MSLDGGREVGVQMNKYRQSEKVAGEGLATNEVKCPTVAEVKKEDTWDKKWTGVGTFVVLCDSSNAD